MINNDDTDNINQVKKDNIENTDKNTDKNNEDKKIFDINNLKNIDKKYLWIGCGVLLFIIILISFIPKNKDKNCDRFLTGRSKNTAHLYEYIIPNIWVL